MYVLAVSPFLVQAETARCVCLLRFYVESKTRFRFTCLFASSTLTKSRVSFTCQEIAPHEVCNAFYRNG